MYPTDDDNDFQRSHSSSLNSSSYLSLYSRKPSLAKSSNTLFERSYITLRYSFKKSRSFIRFGSINEDTEYICNTKSKHQTILKQTSIDESSLSSAHQQSESCQLFTTSAEVNFNSLTMPSALSRKPSITFNETVFVFRSERRNSSPGMFFVLFDNKSSNYREFTSRFKFMLWNWGKTIWNREISFSCKYQIFESFMLKIQKANLIFDYNILISIILGTSLRVRCISEGNLLLKILLL